MTELRLHIRLTPKASKNAVQGWVKDADGKPVLKVSVTTVPEKGKANKALIAFLSKEWDLPKSSIILEKGETDRNKTLLLQDISSAQKTMIFAGNE